MGELTMTRDDVLRVHREEFYAAFQSNDLQKLSDVYADDYVLMRGDGSVLSKAQILEDLKTHPMTFKKLELANEVVHIHGSVGILTGVARTVAVRNGQESDVHSQMIAVYAEENKKLVLGYFQTTPLLQLAE
jgi:ketosteroid isomerase-like protein